MVNTKLSKNKDWSPGSIVKVGFLSLRVVSLSHNENGGPDIYDLESLDGARTYGFTPHNGLYRVN